MSYDLNKLEKVIGVDGILTGNSVLLQEKNGVEFETSRPLTEKEKEASGIKVYDRENSEYGSSITVSIGALHRVLK